MSNPRQARYILIKGGELRNKGAQAMLFTTICEMRKRFPDLAPVVISHLDCTPGLADKMKGKKSRADAPNLAFAIVYGNTPLSNNVLLGRPLHNLKSLATRVLRVRQIAQLRHFYDYAAFGVDISGFAFGDKWGFERCKDYLLGVEAFKRFEVPVYLLPQSFGPFAFDQEDQLLYIRKRSSTTMAYPRIVFAREQSGLKSLQGLYSADNVVRSHDLVLQSKGIEKSAILRDVGAIPRRLEITTGRNVGIVPNMQILKHGDSAVSMGLLVQLVSRFRENGRDVYLIRHAFEDLEICDSIKAEFADDAHVVVMGEDRYCFEYGKVFEKCDYLIASRYHSIVHAYQVGTPCIALGWAEKYAELLGSFDQGEFAFDITGADFNQESFFKALSKMEAGCERYASSIRERMSSIQKKNVFDLVEADFRSMERGEVS